VEEECPDGSYISDNTLLLCSSQISCPRRQDRLWALVLALFRHRRLRQTELRNINPAVPYGRCDACDRVYSTQVQLLRQGCWPMSIWLQYGVQGYRKSRKYDTTVRRIQACYMILRRLMPNRSISNKEIPAGRSATEGNKTGAN
jgi:hypothetical protein